MSEGREFKGIGKQMTPWKRAAQKDEIIDYSYYFFEDFQTSVSEFYKSVEEALKARKVPDLEIQRLTWSEGGLLSANRLYLRLTRERLVFDICAAPFGTGFFFSCRYLEIHRPMNPLVLLLLLVGSLTVFGLFLQGFGFMRGTLFALIGLLSLIWTLRNSVAIGLTNLDATLMKAPGIGPIYERFFRRETYYRHDTRVMYLQTVPAIVKRLVEEITAANGVKLSQRLEGKPFEQPKFGL
jgi:hypothetical protein